MFSTWPSIFSIVKVRSLKIGFPTIVNNRPAYFSWIPGDEALRFWHFADEIARRPIPPAWLRETEGVRSSKR